MKKFVLLFSTVVLLSAVVFAQSLSLSDSSGVVANNSTIVILRPPSNEYMSSYIWVTNNSGAAIDVKVKKVEKYVTTGHENTFCWDVCYGTTTYVSENPVTINAADTFFYFTGDLNPYSIPGYDTIQYVFFNERNPLDSVCYNVVFVAGYVGIAEKEMPAIVSLYPNPASSVIKLQYNINSSKAEVKLYNLTGTLVKQSQLSQNANLFTMNVSNLPSGVYYISLIENQKIVVTRKVIIAR
ncbi:MAG: T9SS type A sorting domain-containing protein [Lentimicrobiaceae bacterium]|nr:T9SS type A sorting domain-containing protein [Lentimicrobiaceae bacterium]